MRHFLALWMSLSSPAFTAEPDGSWTANAGLKNPREITDHELGNAQGGTRMFGKVYFYGDRNRSTPRVGIIKEYDETLQPTGRTIYLTRQGKPIILHPTGLTHHPDWGTFLGNTVQGKSTIFRLDWQRALADGNLDNAVRDVVVDDAAINGGRPLFVEVDGKAYLATSDYGNVTPQLRLYDPEKLLKEKTTSAPGVTTHRLPVGPFNQNMLWDAETKQITLIQNVQAGRGWQLDVLDLPKAIRAGSVEAPGVRVEKKTYARHDEMEGLVRLGNGEDAFVIGGHNHSIVVGKTVAVAPVVSPIGDTRYNLDADKTARTDCDSGVGRLAGKPKFAETAL